MDGRPLQPEAFFERTPSHVRAYIEQLHTTIADLHRRIAELESKQAKNSTNSSLPPSSEHPHAKPARRTPVEALIPGTVFTSAQVNRHAPEVGAAARMGVHRDDGNSPRAFGAIVVIRVGLLTRDKLVFPQQRVAVDLDNMDCLICDNRQAHGNTPIGGGPGAERLSVVGFFHDSNLD
jgi:hypothetical protein